MGRPRGKTTSRAHRRARCTSSPTSSCLGRAVGRRLADRASVSQGEARRSAGTPQHARARRPQAQRRKRDAATARSSRSARVSPLGFYWPIRGELDLRELARRQSKPAGRPRYPSSSRRTRPSSSGSGNPESDAARLLEHPGARRTARREARRLGDSARRLRPAGFRLGYGGGYYDRTLASLVPRPSASASASTTRSSRRSTRSRTTSRWT